MGVRFTYLTRSVTAVLSPDKSTLTAVIVVSRLPYAGLKHASFVTLPRAVG